MIKINWDTEKAKRLQADETRGGVGFEDCVVAIEEGRILADLTHPTRENQRLLVLEINDYAYVAPYVMETNGIFLKTVFPSRKHNAKYLTGKRS